MSFVLHNLSGATIIKYRSKLESSTIDQIVYRQGYQYINVSPTTIVAPLVVGVVKSPANNSLGLASLEFVPPFSLRWDPQIKLNIVQMKASVKLYKLIYLKSSFIH